MDEFTLRLQTPGLSLTMECLPENDPEWTRCRVDVQVPQFSGQYECNVSLPDLHFLREQLELLRSHIGEAFSVTWDILERNIQLAFQLDDRGHLEVHYRFDPYVVDPRFDDAGPAAVLSGVAHTDQAAIHGWLAQIRNVILFVS